MKKGLVFTIALMFGFALIMGVSAEPVQAEQIVATDLADAVFLARELLRHPYWPLDAARILGHEITWPRQYRRARLG